jgi:murein DD-endopeptidase MepM/ murein hydrolase activator NlpD
MFSQRKKNTSASGASHAGFSIWIVPVGEGRVRKFRISLKLACVAGLLFGCSAGVFGFVLGDYARVQLVRAKSYLWLQMVSGERDRLLSSNRDLAEELETIRTAHTHTLAFEKEARKKLDAIAQAVKTSTAIAVDLKSSSQKSYAQEGLLSGDKRAALTPPTKPGVGGREVICARGDTFATCSKNADVEESARARLSFPTEIQSRAGISATQGDLLGLLGQYSDLISALPMGAPSGGDRSSGFGFRASPFHNGVRLHEGVDYAAAVGAPVVAAADGVVVASARHGTYGLYVDVKHNERIVTRYAHLSKLLVDEGQKIRRGHKVGLVGSTGRSTGPHLHYEVRVDGIPKNPESFNVLGEKLAKIIQ